jgi:hypothetical protein
MHFAGLIRRERHESSYRKREQAYCTGYHAGAAKTGFIP